MKKAIVIICVLTIIFFISFTISSKLLNLKKEEIGEKDFAEENNINDNKQEDKQEDNVKKNNFYYLHKSDLEKPSKDKCLAAKKIFFDKIGEKEKKEIQTELRIHS